MEASHHASRDAPRTARARVRAELTGEIKQEARRQLAAEGAPALSLRAVARELGMVSSALYRYFASRDDLLTALIVDAYDAIGAAAEAADATCPPADTAGRWLAVGRAIRGWALAHPHEYALVYGSPVPGYRAPEETVGPASRVTLVLCGIIAEAAASAQLTPAADLPPLTPALRREAEGIAQAVMGGVPPQVAVRALVAWTQLFGAVSFELFGHFANIVEDNEAFFEQALRLVGAFVGLRGLAGEPA
ncbi:MAG: TetR/AcrR family transcriptional regulator [Acidimicrobiales bacterium]|jgi:AcrR family transcriptional regulator